jgi:hypothetical protein
VCLIDTLKLGDIARFVAKSYVFVVLTVFIFYVIFTINSGFPLYSIYVGWTVCFVSGTN